MFIDAHGAKATLAPLYYSIHSFAITSVQSTGRSL